MKPPRNHRLHDELERQSEHREQADRERGSLLRYSVFLGAVAGLLILPVVAGAYLGLWLDQRGSDYSSFWTLSLILVGLAIGIFNVYRYLRDRL